MSLGGIKQIRRAFCLLALLLICAAPVRAHAEQQPATSGGDGEPLDCAFILDTDNIGKEERLRDGDVRSCVRVKRGGSIGMLLPADATQLYIAWHSLPTAPLVTFLDAAEELSAVALDATLLYHCVPIPAGSTRAVLSAERGFAVSELRAYATLPEDILRPKPSAEKADVLLIVAHTGDESYYFGGLIPLFAGEKDYTLSVLFLSSKSRLACEEAMLSLAACGVEEQPLFAGFTYRLRPYGKNSAQALWGDQLAANHIAGVIRACRPEIVVTHEAGGEDGDAMHAYAQTLVQRAVERAADPIVLPVEGGRPEAWQIARLYEHSTYGGGIELPVDAPLPAMDGLSAKELAQQAHDRYAFLKLYHKTELAGSWPCYTLAREYRAPSRDPFWDLSIDAMPTPTPAPTPVVTPRPSPTATVDTTEADLAAARELAAKARRLLLFDIGARVERNCPAIMGLGGLLSAILVLYLALRRKEKPYWRLALCMLPLALAALVAFGLPAAIGEPEPVPVPTPTPTATPTPTPEPTPTPSSTPDPDDAYFRREGEPEEFVIFDNDAGRYVYRTDTLSVEVQRHDVRNNNNDPVRYFAAHIRMRGEDAFRPGFGNYRENGDDPADPREMARRYQAVLAISGDNMINFDTKNKGVLIRNGNLYLDNPFGDAMVFTPDGMSMYIQPANSIRAQDLLDMGVENCFSFGPTLLINGVYNERANQHYLAGYNPRVGVGLVDEGHFVAIVVEGRVGKYSRGVRMEELAQLFLQEGCTLAYNLDGGASSSMLFMGEYVNRRMPDQYRNVPDLLMWGYSEQVPGVDQEPVNDIFYRG